MDKQEFEDRKFMNIAIEEAIKSRELGDYAIGCAISKNGRLLVKTGNRIRTDLDPTSHTEIVAIRLAVRVLGSRYLKGCIMYSTHEPCPMCTTACIWARVNRIVYGASQLDIRNYGQKYGNDLFKWRAILIKSKFIISKSDDKYIKVDQFMQQECKQLFHND